ncbi:MAG: class I SAM-dependent methyltransferase [Pirellulales bacterium]
MNPEQLRLNARIEDEHWWFVGRRRILARLADQLVPCGPENLVIDVGCGTGANLAEVARQRRGVGIDTSPEAVALARQRFAGVEFRQGDALTDLADVLPLARLVLLTDVLEHVRDDFALFSGLLAAVAPGAWFLVTVPADPDLWSEHDESHLHYRRYTRERFERIWHDLPVDVTLVSAFNSRLYLPIKAVRTLNRRRGRAVGQAGTDLFLPPRPVNRFLTALYASEGARLERALSGGRSPYAAGVSLLAVLRRRNGEMVPRHKPGDLQVDQFDPVAAGAVSSD